MHKQQQIQKMQQQQQQQQHQQEQQEKCQPTEQPAHQGFKNKLRHVTPTGYPRVSTF